MKLLLLHLVGCLYYRINDARSHKHQMTKLVDAFAIVQTRLKRPSNLPTALFGCKY